MEPNHLRVLFFSPSPGFSLLPLDFPSARKLFAYPVIRLLGRVFDFLQGVFPGFGSYGSALFFAILRSYVGSPFSGGVAFSHPLLTCLGGFWSLDQRKHHASVNCVVRCFRPRLLNSSVTAQHALVRQAATVASLSSHH